MTNKLSSLPSVPLSAALFEASDEDLLSLLSAEEDTNTLRLIGQELYTRLILRGGYTFQPTEEEEEQMRRDLDAMSVTMQEDEQDAYGDSPHPRA